MKITAVDTCVLTVPTRHQMALQFPHHKLVVAEISTDAGAKGLGYSMVFNGGGAEAVHTYLETRLKPALIGEDPLYVERLWEKMFRVDMGIKKQGVAAYALSVADIALWDLAAKVAKLPLHKLWGAHTDRVACYGSGGWGKYSGEGPRRRSRALRRAGLKYYKMKIHDPDPTVNREARRGGAEGARRQGAHDGRRQPAAGRAGQRSPGRAPGGPRSGLVRGAGAGGRSRGTAPRWREGSRSRSQRAKTISPAGNSAI